MVVAVHSLPEPKEHIQILDRLLAQRVARESRNSWMAGLSERKKKNRGEEQWKTECKQSGPVPRLYPLESSQENRLNERSQLHCSV